MIRRTTHTLVLLAVVAAAFLAGSWHSQRETASAAPLPAHRLLYYVDPMHPSYKSGRPGTAPDCGMALVPVYADDGHANADATDGSALPPDVLAVSAEQQRLIGVRVSTVEQASGVERLRLFGRVTPEEARIFKLNVGVDGYIRDISSVTTGSQVTKDQWLATFSTPESRQPLQGYLVSLDVLDRETKSGSESPAQIALAKAGTEQAIDRLLTMGMSRVQIDEVSRTRLVPPNIRMHAPTDGFVLARNVSAGQKFDKGAELFRIADLRHVWILANVSASDADKVRAGMDAQVTVAGRTTPLRARVSSAILPQFDAAAQTLQVRVEADNPGYALRPDMFVDVDLDVPYRSTVVVPAEAVVRSGLHDTVFVERSAGRFEPQDVELGRRLGDRVEILHGLEAGQRVVVAGTFFLDSDRRMKTHDQPHH
jgi:membrane fusion protein, copper/silver efflux system